MYLLIILITVYIELSVKLESYLSYILKICFSINGYLFPLLSFQSQDFRSVFSDKVLLSPHINLHIYLKIIIFKCLRNLILQVQDEQAKMFILLSILLESTEVNILENKD